jgi:hypothetical protein
MITCLIASNGVYSFVVIANVIECLADLPKYFAGRLSPGESVTPSAKMSDSPVVVEWSFGSGRY